VRRTGLDHAHDVGVIELAEDLDLAFEPRALGTERQRTLAHDLERHGPARGLLHGAIDRALTAAMHEPFESIAGNRIGRGREFEADVRRRIRTARCRVGSACGRPRRFPLPPRLVDEMAMVVDHECIRGDRVEARARRRPPTSASSRDRCDRSTPGFTRDR